MGGKKTNRLEKFLAGCIGGWHNPRMSQTHTLSFMPMLFQVGGHTSPGTALEAIQPDSKWLDAVGHLSLYCGRSIPDTRQAFESLLAGERDPAHRGVLLAGIARCLNSQMRLREGGPLLGQAWSLVSGGASGEQRAFVMLEMARFMLLIGNGDGIGLALKFLWLSKIRFSDDDKLMGAGFLST